MVRPASLPLDPPADLDDQVILFPTWRASHVLTEVPAPAAVRPATIPQVPLRTRVIRQIVVVEVAGRLGDVVEDLDREIQLALADGPRGVVCDLSAILPGADPEAVELLASAGRHARDWPGIPVAVACTDPRVLEALEAHPLGGRLIVKTSLFSAVSAVLATPILEVEWLGLAPHPTAPRAAREFITRTLLDWRLGRVIPFATLVVSELVASSSINTGTEIEVSVAWHLGALRLGVRDGPGRPDQPSPALALRGRRLAVVAGLSRAHGVMPAGDGGKVVWAVLDAPRPTPATRRIRSVRVPESEDSPVLPPVLTDGGSLAELPFAGSIVPGRSAAVSRQGAERLL